MSESFARILQDFEYLKGKKMGLCANVQCEFSHVPACSASSLGCYLALFWLRPSCAFPSIIWEIANSSNYIVRVYCDCLVLGELAVDMKSLGVWTQTRLCCLALEPEFGSWFVLLGNIDPVSSLGHLVVHGAQACCGQADIARSSFSAKRDNFKYKGNKDM